MAKPLNQVVAELQTRGRLGGGVAVPAASGASEAAQQVAQGFASVADKIGALADRAAAREGEASGRAAGQDPEFRTRRDGTIRGEAFDRAGLDVAETRLKVELDEGMTRIFEASKGDAGKMAGALDGMAQGMLSRAPEELRPGLEGLVKGKKLSLMREAARERVERQRADAAAALQADLAHGLKALHQKAYSLGLDAEADKAVAADLVALERTLSRGGIDGQPLVSPGQRQKLLAGAREEVTTARLYGAFGRLPGVEAKEQFLKDLEADFAASRGLAKEYDLPTFQRVAGHLEAELRAAKVERRAAANVLADEVRSVQAMAEKGFGVPPDRLASIKARVAVASDPALQEGLAQAEALAHWQAAARRATPAEIDAFVRSETARLSADGADPRSVKRLEIAERLAGEMRTELKADQLGWADRVGVVKLAPLDLSSVDAAAVSLKARLAQADAVADAYALEPKYLRPAERQALAAMMARGGEEVIAVTTMLTQAAGEQAPAVLAEIAEHAPVMGLLGGHVAAVGPTPVAKDAAAGLALMRTKDFKPLAPPAARARAAAMEVLGTATAELPQFEAAAIGVANAIYEVRARQRSLTEFDDAIWKQGLSEALGERTIGGKKYGGIVAQSGWMSAGDQVVLPPNVAQRTWRELIDAVRLDDLVAANGAPLYTTGKPAPISAVHRARLVTVGTGRYWLATGDTDNPRYLMDGRGGEYVLDLGALEGRLRKRRPDLYLGGGE